MYINEKYIGVCSKQSIYTYTLIYIYIFRLIISSTDSFKYEIQLKSNSRNKQTLEKYIFERKLPIKESWYNYANFDCTLN